MATQELVHAELFLSWCHRDHRLQADLLERLRPNLDILSGLSIGWWMDSHLRLGDDFREEILRTLDACDYGMLLLSPGFYASPFIRTHELPRFVGPSAVKGALPVALRAVPLDGSRELHGVQAKQIFTYRGKAFGQLSGTDRDGFASELATQIRRRLLGEP